MIDIHIESNGKVCIECHGATTEEILANIAVAALGLCWERGYSVSRFANALIEGDKKSGGITVDDKTIQVVKNVSDENERV